MKKSFHSSDKLLYRGGADAINAVSVTLFADAEGKLVKHQAGMVSEAVLEKYIRDIGGDKQ